MFRLCGHSFWNTLLPGIHKFMIIELKGKKWVNCCLAKVEGGCLGYPGASTVASQPLDRISLPWLANPATQPWAPIPGTCQHWMNQWRKERRRVGWGMQTKLEKPQSARDSKPSSASCLKTQTATWYAKANTLKQSWNKIEPCEPALEYVTADQEKVPA